MEPPLYNLAALFLTKEQLSMRYPNLRYGNPNEFAYYVQGVPVKDVAKRLRRSERSVKNWLQGKEKVPWWIPELLRLQQMEYEHSARHMNMTPVRKQLGIVGADVIEFTAPKQPIKIEELHEQETPCVDLPGYTADRLRFYKATVQRGNAHLRVCRVKRNRGVCHIVQQGRQFRIGLRQLCADLPPMHSLLQFPVGFAAPGQWQALDGTNAVFLLDNRH